MPSAFAAVPLPDRAAVGALTERGHAASQERAEHQERAEDLVHAAPLEQPPTGRWPHALSHDPLMRLSDVLAVIQSEFPALSSSKLRFLDAQGLVVPQRTAGGYRQYSPADVERLRFVLREQRDHFRPLSLIADRLAALDSGEAREAVLPHEVGEEQSPWITAAELARLAGVGDDLVASLDAEGIIEAGMPGRYRREAIAVVHSAAGYLAAGGDLRAARVLRNAATREADQAKAVAAPLRAKGERGEADNAAGELGEAAVRLFGAVVRQAVQRY
jgi:DNA-binding transcriptional MerR regulator